MNIIVTGANGQLGCCFKDYAITHKEHSFRFLTHTEADFTDAASLTKSIENVLSTFAQTSSTILINCAAYTNVDKAEEYPNEANAINATALKFIADSCFEHNLLFVHISTDYVFGIEDKGEPIKEDAPFNPTGEYAKSKLQGEQYIKESQCHSITIRTSWLYSQYGHNFVKTILNLAQKMPELKVVNDQVGTPTYAPDLCNAIMHILEMVCDENDFCEQNGKAKKQPRHQTYHYSNMGECSWYLFAKKILEYANLTTPIMPCTSNEFPSKVKRPAYSVLDKSKIIDTFGLDIPKWEESLKDCVKTLIEDKIEE